MFTLRYLKSDTPDCRGCTLLRKPPAETATSAQITREDTQSSIHLHLECNDAKHACKKRETVTRIQGQVLASGKTVGVELGGTVAGRWEEENEWDSDESDRP